MKNAFLLYETDQWLSTSDRVLFGVCTTKKQLGKAVRKLAIDQFKRGVIIDEYEEGKRNFINGVWQDVERNGQYSGYDAGIYVQEITLNQFGEI